jgi:hypothetical protein
MKTVLTMTAALLAQTARVIKTNRGIGIASLREIRRRLILAIRPRALDSRHGAFHVRVNQYTINIQGLRTWL